jgi:hypothetical protein
MYVFCIYVYIYYHPLEYRYKTRAKTNTHVGSREYFFFLYERHLSMGRGEV